MEAPAQQCNSRVKAIREQPGETTVMFVGAPGAGKSSLINTLVNVVDSSVESPKQEMDRCVPTAPSDLMGGHTMMREPVKLTDTVTIVDNRGWHDWGNEVALQEFCAQINGERSFVEKVDWEKGGKVYKQVTGLPLVVAKKITCIAVVINGVGGVDSVHGLKKLIDSCIGDVGRLPTVVVTHKDKISDDKGKKIQSTLEKVYGISKDRIFIIQNMSEVDALLDDDSNSRLLDFLDRCISDGKKGAEFHEEKKELKEKVWESQKEIEASRKKKREVEEAEAAAQELKKAEHEKELQKVSHEQLKLHIATGKAKALAQIEEDVQKDARKSAQNINKEREALMKMQLTAQEQLEKKIVQFQEVMKAEVLRNTLEMNRLEEQKEKDAQERTKERMISSAQKEEKLFALVEGLQIDNVRHAKLLNSMEEQDWVKSKESAPKSK